MWEASHPGISLHGGAERTPFVCSEKAAIPERLIHEIPRVRVELVQAAKLGEVLAGLDLKPAVQGQRFDRVILDGETDGFVRVHVRNGTDEIIGATVVAAHAGDLIGELTLAMTGKLGLKIIGATIHPYPTQAEAVRKTGDLYNRTRLTPFVKKLIGRWLAWSP